MGEIRLREWPWGLCARWGVLGGKRMEVAADGAPAEVGARGFVARVGGKSVADRVRSHRGIAAKARSRTLRLRACGATLRANG